MSDTIAPPVEPQVPPTPRSRKPFYAGVGVAAVALAAGGAALGISLASHTTPATTTPAAVKVLPQTEGPRNLGTAGPAQLNGSPANMQKLAAQTPTLTVINPPGRPLPGSVESRY